METVKRIGSALVAFWAEYRWTATFVFLGAASAVPLVAFPANLMVTILSLLIGAFANSQALWLAIASASPTSGGHINPEVTLSIWLAKVEVDGKPFSFGRAISYWLAQLLGSITGGGLLLIFPNNLAIRAGFGTPTTPRTYDTLRAMALEFIISLVLIGAVHCTILDKDAPKWHAGNLVGVAAFVGILVAGLYTGGAMNSARWFGPALVAQFYGIHHDWLRGILIYVVPQVAAAICVGLPRRIGRMMP